jgi:hypothetical protein
VKPLLITGALAFAAGVLVALIAIPRPKPEVVEKVVLRDRIVEAKATAAVETRIVETPGPVQIRRIIVRTRGPEESCGERVEEVETRDAGGRKVIEEATRIATETKERTHDQTRVVAGSHRDWTVFGLLGGSPVGLRDHRWVAGLGVSRRIIAGLGAGGFVLGAPGPRVEAGLMLTWSW